MHSSLDGREAVPVEDEASPGDPAPSDGSWNGFDVEGVDLTRPARMTMLFQEVWPVDPGLVDYEALCRVRGFDTETLFCRARSEGFLLPLGRLCRALVCDVLDRSPSFPGRVWINVEPDEVLPSLLEEPLLRSHAGRLVFELTERAVLSDRAIPTMDQLARAGSCIAVDDLGDGHSNLARLELPFLRYAKLPRGSVLRLLHDESLFIEAVLERCAEIGIEVVAEGVETPAQALGVLRRGFHRVQGYLLHRPERLTRLQGRSEAVRDRFRSSWLNAYWKVLGDAGS